MIGCRGIGNGTGARATAAVEFALVLPLLLVLGLALLQVALLAQDQLVLNGSARAGAREAAVTTDDSAVWRAVVAAAAGLESERLEMTVVRESGAGTAVTVELLYRTPVRVAAVGWLFPDSVALSASATMRQEAR